MYEIKSKVFVMKMLKKKCYFRSKKNPRLLTVLAQFLKNLFYLCFATAYIIHNLMNLCNLRNCYIRLCSVLKSL